MVASQLEVTMANAKSCPWEEKKFTLYMVLQVYMGVCVKCERTLVGIFKT